MFWTWVRKQPKSQTRWEPAALTGLMFLHMLTQLIPLKLSHHYWVFSGFKGSKFTNFILKLWIFTHIHSKDFSIILTHLKLFCLHQRLINKTSDVTRDSTPISPDSSSGEFLTCGETLSPQLHALFIPQGRKWKREFCPTLGAAARLQTPSCFRSFLSKIHAATKCESLKFFDQKTQIFRAKIWRSLHKTDWSVLSL